jgi:hypothetical protein
VEYDGLTLNQAHTKSVVRFGLVRKVNRDGLVPEAQFTVELQSPCPTLRNQPYAATLRMGTGGARQQDGGAGGGKMVAPEAARRRHAFLLWICARPHAPTASAWTWPRRVDIFVLAAAESPRRQASTVALETALHRQAAVASHFVPQCAGFVFWRRDSLARGGQEDKEGMQACWPELLEFAVQQG